MISSNAIILENITIGTDAVVAASTVVNKDVPPHAIVGGVPAKIIKYRFNKKTINRLLNSQWSEASPKHLIQLTLYYSDANQFLTLLKNL